MYYSKYLLQTFYLWLFEKTESFDIKLNDFLLLMAFFNSKQRLILKYNYFNSKEEIIDKLLEKSKMPLALYYYYDYYII